MSARESADLIPAMFDGMLFGGPDGFAACDTCNRSLTDGHREHDPDDAEADTVFAYATRVRDTNQWSLRWVSCESCGPPGDGEADKPGETVVQATVAYDALHDAFAFSDSEFTDQS
jgi:hypothetical protein